MPNPIGSDVSTTPDSGAGDASAEAHAGYTGTLASMSQQLQHLQAAGTKQGEQLGVTCHPHSNLLFESLVLMARNLDDWRSHQEVLCQSLLVQQKRTQHLLEGTHAHAHAHAHARQSNRGDHAASLVQGGCELGALNHTPGPRRPIQLPLGLFGGEEPLLGGESRESEMAPSASQCDADPEQASADDIPRTTSETSLKARFAPVAQPAAEENDETEMSVGASSSQEANETEHARPDMRRLSFARAASFASSGFGRKGQNQMSRMDSNAVLEDARSHWTALRTRPQMGLASAKDLATHPNSILLTLVKSKFYDACVLMMISLNTIFIGVQVQHAAAAMGQPAQHYREPPVFVAMEFVFFVVFLVEWLMRVGAYGVGLFKVEDASWNIFDTGVVFIMVLEQVERLFVGLNMPLSQVAALRMLRAVRVIRAVRMLHVLRFLSGLRVLLQTVVIALKSMVWTGLVVLAMLYIFSVIFTQGTVDYCAREPGCLQEADLLLSFGGIDRSLISLFQTMTSGIAWHDLLVQLEVLPSFYWLLFIIYVAVAYFAILNVVTGIFVETTLQVANLDREDIITEEMRNKEVYMQKVHQIFVDMDTDESNSLTLEEFKLAVKDKRVIAYFNALELDFTDVATLFVLLDRDQSGCINLDEFLRGCMRLKGQARSLDIAKIQYELEWLMHNITFLLDHVTGTQSNHASEEPLDDWGGDLRAQSKDEVSQVTRTESTDVTVSPAARIANKVKKEFNFQSEPISDVSR